MEVLVEQWLPIQGYEGRYDISNYGRVKSIARFRKGRSGCQVPVLEKIMSTPLKKETNRTKPYAEIKLRDGSPRNIPCKSFLVHRLVAQAFIGGLDGNKQVDHIDGNHSNNKVDNLRILTPIEHGRLHPCIVDKDRFNKMQEKSKQKSKQLRDEGRIVGRYKVY